jgi:hypothetical protein
MYYVWRMPLRKAAPGSRPLRLSPTMPYIRLTPAATRVSNRPLRRGQRSHAEGCRVEIEVTEAEFTRVVDPKKMVRPYVADDSQG